MKEEIAPSWLCWQCGAGLWGVGRAAAAPAPCHGQAGQCPVPLCAGQCCHHVLPHCPTGRELLSLPTARPFPLVFRMLEWLHILNLLARAGVGTVAFPFPQAQMPGCAHW